MNLRELPIIGTNSTDGATRTWEDVNLSTVDRILVDAIAPGSNPSDIQVKVLESGLLDYSRKNLLISSPTNSGKSLVSYFGIFRAVQAGRRILLLEPLRSIAEEKRDELEELAEKLEPELGRLVKIDIVTGDYQLNEDTLQSPPPDEGEIVVATPERIEGVMRNPDYLPWIESFSLVCVDEAHLVGDALRGRCLEFVITSFLVATRPPRLLLMSATLGNTEDLEKWLVPCDVLRSDVRRPALKRTIVELEDGERDTVIKDMAKSVLQEEGTFLLIFVYQKSGADKLARDLTTELGGICGVAGARAYHAGLSRLSKKTTHELFLRGDCRCVVSTTALAMGVNLPATHVFIRDLSRFGEGPIPLAELVQMSGRAGRGTTNGQATFFLKPYDGYTLEELFQSLQDGNIAQVTSCLADASLSHRGNGTHDLEPPTSRAVLSLLARNPQDGWTSDQLNAFFCRTLGGVQQSLPIDETVAWLVSPSRILSHSDGVKIVPTALGLAASRSGMGLETSLGIAGLFRDLMWVDGSDGFLKSFSPLDVLVLIELVSSKAYLSNRFSEKLCEQLDAWMDRSSEKSILFREWIVGAKGFSKAEEVLGSLGLTDLKSEQARAQGYKAFFRAMVLWQRAHGRSTNDLERTWNIKELREVEDGWKTDRLHVLNGLLPLLDLRCFYYHLVEECEADTERIQRVKRALQRMRVIIYQLRNLLVWCHPLGPIFVKLRQVSGSGQRPGLATMVRLGEAGVDSISTLRGLSLEGLVALGVRKDLARQIAAFLRR